MAHVEARSLATINQIAAHPPQYPINPTERHETLTLYISRVPGCRDIILSTFKPQKKNVGGDDIANALYYVHLDTSGDEFLAPKSAAVVENGTSRRSIDSTRTQDRPKIARKPLPSTARVPHLQEPPSTATTPTEQVKYPPLSLTSHNKENMPLNRDAVSADPSLDQTQMQPPPLPAKIPIDAATAAANGPIPGPVQRKPLGPRPLSTGPHSPGRELSPPAPPQPPAVLNLSATPTSDEARPDLPPRPTPGPLRIDQMPPRSLDEIRETHSPAIRSPGLQSPVTPSRSPSPQSKRKSFTPFSLSIIRRDPGTGHQWNVGKVSSFQSTILSPQDPYNPDSPEVAQYPKGYPAINVLIETSGYARFRNFPVDIPKMPDFSRMSLDSARPGLGENAVTRNMKELAASLQAQAQAQAEQHKDQDPSEEGFRRQVVMTYGKTWTSNLKEAFSGKKHERSSTNTSSTDPAYNEPSDPSRAGFHRRQDSGNSTNSNDSMFGSLVPNPVNNDQNANNAKYANQHNHHHNHHHHQHHHSAEVTGAANITSPQTGKPGELVIPTQPGGGLRPKGYTFASPWGGQCEFRTSSNGRALKCRHVRNTTSQGFNPLVAAQAIRDAAMPESNSGGGGGGARRRMRGMSASLPVGDTGNRVPVSELRFNLPSSDLFNSKEDRDRAVAEMKEGLGRLLLRSPGGPEFDDDDDGEEPIFDFSGLGKEKAGGGNRGKRAKLGKLLVYDEGLKMLDLVVAANMGIWWQAWERSF